MNKSAIVVASFGTSYPVTEKRCIVPIETLLAKLFPNFTICRAFTSQVIINKLRLEGKEIHSPLEVVKNLYGGGYTHVIVQPLLLLKGHEYDKKIWEPLKGAYPNLIISDPLLSTREDIEQIVQILDDISSQVGGQQVLAMGHGTDHEADMIYAQINQLLQDQKIGVRIGTVEGAVRLSQLISFLDVQKGPVHLFPFMLVAGDHATNDMAGETESWKSILEAQGFEVVCHMQGLGELIAIRRLFVSHVSRSKRILFPEQYERMGKGKKSWSLPREEINWSPTVDSSRCTGCGDCVCFCPKGVYSFDELSRKALVRNPMKCVVGCSKCSSLCRAGAISFPVESGITR